MTIKKFFAFSVIVHVIIILSVYFLPVLKEKKPAEFLASLVSPDELNKSGIKLPQEDKVKPLSKKTTSFKKAKSVPSLPRSTHKVPMPQTPLAKSRPKNFSEKPVSPWEGKNTGAPLADGVYPKSDIRGRETLDSAVKSIIQPKSSEKTGYSVKEKLFDKNIIDDAAKKDLGTEANRDNAITFDTKEYRYAGYMKKLREKIESIWDYPQEAILKRIYGDLKIRFTIKKNGRLGAIELVRTSGYKMLDDAAIKALKDGEPYWPLPDEWGMESYTISGHFVYTMYGYSIK